jgi:hypothetical protein
MHHTINLHHPPHWPEKNEVISIRRNRNHSHRRQSWIGRIPQAADPREIRQRPNTALDRVKYPLSSIWIPVVDVAVDREDVLVHLPSAPECPFHRFFRFDFAACARAALLNDFQSASSIAIFALLSTASMSIASILRRKCRSRARRSMSRTYSLAVPYPPAFTCSATKSRRSGGSDRFILVRMPSSYDHFASAAICDTKNVRRGSF